MARYDKDTAEFMEKVADQQFFKLPRNRKERREKIEDLTRKGMFVTKGLLTSPQSAIRAIGSIATGSALEKAAAMSPTKLFVYLNQNYKRDWWDWEPETIWQTLKVDEGIEANDDIKNMIQALQVIVNTNYAHEMWHVFENVGQAFNNNVVSFGIMQPLELNEAAYTIKAMQDIRPEQEFEDDICGYIAASAKESGVVYLPEELFIGGCQEKLDELNNDIGLRNEVASIWPGKATETTSPEAEVQLARLDEIQKYVS